MKYTLAEKKKAINMHLNGTKPQKIFTKFNIPRRTYYNWLKAFKNEGWKGLEEKSRAPLKPNIKVTPLMRRKIIGLREDLGIGCHKIQEIMRENGDDIGKTTIHKILKQEKLI